MQVYYVVRIQVYYVVQIQVNYADPLQVYCAAYLLSDVISAAYSGTELAAPPLPLCDGESSWKFSGAAAGVEGMGSWIEGQEGVAHQSPPVTGPFASVSYLAGLREMLPPQSQREEIDELRATLARVPLPILVLLDDLDRMQREEILVLLKILRGAGSIPNVTFICAFSERQVRKVLGKDLSEDYLEKFFPVTVLLTSPEPEVLGELFRQRLTEAFCQQHWFPNAESEKNFSELLERVWGDSLSRLCTNLRKVGLLLNDIVTAARPIVGEVNVFDLAVIETVRHFYPEVYRTVRKNPLFLTYARSNWSKGRFFTEEEKKNGAEQFFKALDASIPEAGDRQAVEGMLSWIFPDYAASKTKGSRFYGLSRRTDEEIAEREKRICDPDYFSIYFRAAVPQEMFSEAELREVLDELAEAKSDSAVLAVFGRALDAIPKGHPKRDDFLWKIGRAIALRTSDVTAEPLAMRDADHVQARLHLVLR